MHGSHDFLWNLALVLCVAAATTVVFQRLRQPAVLGYLIAGLVVGPHVPVPLVADLDTIHTLSELGVILLMFSIGLEFSFSKLSRVGPAAGLIAIVQVSIMIWLGYVTGQLFGWTRIESLFLGAIIAISSTTIIAKAFEEQRMAGKLREVVFGVLIVEDLIAILLLAALTTISTGRGMSAGALASTVGRLVLFLLGLVVGGLLVVPRAIRYVVRLGRPETTLVASIGICFAAALLSRAAGYSVALGAFLAGSLVAESGQGAEVEHLARPVRDIFAAVFFVSVGMLIDPALVARHWAAIAVITVIVVLGKVLGVTLGAFLAGEGLRTSIRAGMSLAQIGEFSFIIAGLGLSLGATRDFLYPVAAAVSGLTTLLTPWLIRASGPVASRVDRTLPGPLQTFASFYGSWIEQLRSAPRRETMGRRLRRLGGLMFLDATLLGVIVIGAAVAIQRYSPFVAAKTGLRGDVVSLGTVVVAASLCLPFCIGIVRAARRFGRVLAEEALPVPAGEGLDLALSPRRALAVLLQLACLLLVGIPLVAVTQPFLPPFNGALVLALLVVPLALALWRSAVDFQGHVRAGAQVIVEALATQARGDRERGATRDLEQVRQVLPGLGSPISVEITASGGAAGRTLADLNLRGITGASVVAIHRGDQDVVIPTGHETLRPGDVLALAGTHEAIESAQRLLEAPAGRREHHEEVDA